jgi:hypothetical protein
VDDKATSVALNIAIAEEYVLRPLERDLVIAFFDAEEPPFFLGDTMGSRRFCEDHCRDIRFAAVIVTDLVGHDFSATDLSLPSKVDLVAPHLRKLVFMTGAESRAEFPGIVEKVAGSAKGIRVVPTLHRYVGNVSDHQAFATQGQPFLFLSCGQGRHYHSRRDGMEWINFEKLARVTRFVADVMEEIDRTPDAESGPSPCDPVDFEIRMFRRAAGPLLPLVLKYFDIVMPGSRAELDNLISGLINGKLPRSGSRETDRKPKANRKNP